MRKLLCYNQNMNKGTANPQNDNEQTNSQNEPINNKTDQVTQEESLKTADNFKKETTDNIKKRKTQKSMDNYSHSCEYIGRFWCRNCISVQ